MTKHPAKRAVKARLMYFHQPQLGVFSPKGDAAYAVHIYGPKVPVYVLGAEDYDALVEQMAKALLQESKESPWMECADKPNYFHRARCALRSIGIRKPTRK